MQVLVTGGTGFIGAPLCAALLRDGHEVVVVTRRPERPAPAGSVRYVGWETSDWQHALERSQAVVNLAGEPIAAGRWTAARKLQLRESRVGTTRRLVSALSVVAHKPQVLISASAVGYYGPRGDERLAEDASPGAGFLAETCREWEQEARRAEPLGIRTVLLRIGLVLGPGGGALDKMIPPFRLFLGGPLGSGRQWMSWIHREDVIGLTQWALDDPNARGTVNATAPEPVRMRTFCAALGRVLGRPSWAPVPAFVLRLLLGEMAQILLTGQQVLPRAALQGGYRFRHPELEGALRACLSR